MSSNPAALAYMHVKSSAQGAFLSDNTRAGKDRTICLAVRFRGEVPHDVRTPGSYAVTQHEPIGVVRYWSASTAQFLTAMWNNETLDEVRFEFVRQDDRGKEVTYATLTLSKATVAYVEMRSGDTQDLLEGDHQALENIGLRAEKIEFKFKQPHGDASAVYDRGGSQ